MNKEDVWIILTRLKETKSITYANWYLKSKVSIETINSHIKQTLEDEKYIHCYEVAEENSDLFNLAFAFLKQKEIRNDIDPDSVLGMTNTLEELSDSVDEIQSTMDKILNNLKDISKKFEQPKGN